MMNLTKHLNIEYNLHSDLLSVFESHGVLYNSDVFSLKIRDIIMDNVKDNELSEKIIVNSEMDCFDDITIYANISIVNSESHIRESYYNYDSKLRHPKIYLNIIGDFMYVRNSIAPTICHELLHAYEDNMERVSGSREISYNVGGFYKLSKIIMDNNKLFSNNTAMFAKCVYWLSDVEQRANIGTLELELKQHKSGLSNPIEAKETIESTNLYSTYLTIKNFVDLMIRWPDNEIDCVCSDIESHISNFDTNRTAIKEQIKSLTKSLKKFKDKFDVVSSKLAYDIATENKYRF